MLSEVRPSCHVIIGSGSTNPPLPPSGAAMGFICGRGGAEGAQTPEPAKPSGGCFAPREPAAGGPAAEYSDNSDDDDASSLSASSVTAPSEAPRQPDNAAALQDALAFLGSAPVRCACAPCEGFRQRA